MIITLRMRNILLRRQDIDLEGLLARDDYATAFADLCNTTAWIAQVLVNQGAFAMIIGSERAGEILGKSTIALRRLVAHPDLRAIATTENEAIKTALRPVAPTIIEPVADFQEAREPLKIKINKYKSPVMEAQTAVQFVLMKQGQEEAVYDSGESVPVVTHDIPGGVLEASTNYSIKVRVKDNFGLWSAWAVTNIVTAESVVSVISPAISIDDDVEKTGLEFTMTTSPFAVSSGEDAHAATQWQVLAEGQEEPVYDSGEDSVNLTVNELPGGILRSGGYKYAIRVRHKGEVSGWSAWSLLNIQTAPGFVLGAVLVRENVKGGEWAYIDKSGNVIPKPDDNYFHVHPVFAGAVDVRIDGQYMVRLPKFYCRHTVVKKGTYLNYPVYWISDMPDEDLGLSPHPAFLEDGEELDQIYIGKYQASLQDEKMASVPSVMPVTGKTLQAWRGHATARNVGGVTGFAVYSPDAHAAIQLLYIIKHGTMDSQEITGMGRVNATTKANVDATDVAEASFLGIVGLWGNIEQFVDYFYIANEEIVLPNETLLTNSDGSFYGYPESLIPGDDPNIPSTLYFCGAGECGAADDLHALVPDWQKWLSDEDPLDPLRATVGGHYAYGKRAGLWAAYYGPSSNFELSRTGTRLMKR